MIVSVDAAAIVFVVLIAIILIVDFYVVAGVVNNVSTVLFVL